ncbi:MAG: hypothetical protein ACYCPQ_11220, partial [Elusimicrobiota bacterium]
MRTGKSLPCVKLYSCHMVLDRILVSTLTLAILAMGLVPARAATKFVLYQGELLSNGIVSTGTASIEFRITNGNSVSCGASLPATNLYWTSGVQTVAVSSGVFSYKLGLKSDQVTQDPPFLGINWGSATAAYDIDVCVAGISLSPHEPIGSSVYALYSSSAGALTVTSPGGIVIADGSQGLGKVLTSDANGEASWQTSASGQWTTVGSGIYYNGGNVGISTGSPQTGLDIETASTSGYSLKLSSGINMPLGTVTAAQFVGSGAGLSGVTATVSANAPLTGNGTGGSPLGLGEVPTSLLPSTVAYTSQSNTFTSSQTISGAGGLGVAYGLSAGTGTFSGVSGYGVTVTSGVSVGQGVYASFFVGSGAGLSGVTATVSANAPLTGNGTGGSPLGLGEVPTSLLP